MKNRHLVPLLAVGFATMLTVPASAQLFKALHSFGPSFDGTNSDGTCPSGGLVVAGDTLYGVASGGCTPGDGSVFAIKTSGTGFTNLHMFTIRVADGSGFFRNMDGASPQAPLLLSGNVLYGAASEGGQWGNGVVFAVRTDGSSFSTVYTFNPTAGSPAGVFTNSDGSSPSGHLILSGGTLYGTTAYGGLFGSGTIFKVNTDGSGFRTLHSFSAPSPWASYANSDGNTPPAGLMLSSNTLYGVAAYGGTSGNGTVFAINRDGSDFRTLHSFSAISGGVTNSTNSDGGNPYGALVASGNMLYGTASVYGSFGHGTVFKVKMDGTEFSTLYSFAAYPSRNSPTNSDGTNPYGGLILSGNTLYGTASGGGGSGGGTVFKLNTDGSGFAALYSFTALSGYWFTPPRTNRDGAQPSAGLFLSGNMLYGTAVNGGAGGSGTIFSIMLQPQLEITLSKTNVILTWPTNATGFVLQSTKSLISPVVWSTVSQPAVVVNGLNTVTNAIYGTEMHYRLSL
jgi:uncharacterized repeat protein (TIGR03803 family)